MDNKKTLFHQMLYGQQDALKTLLNEYHNYLVVVGLRYLTDRHRVEDVIHDVFADLWNRQKDVEIKYGVKSFLRGAVINKCLAIIRKDSRIELVEDHSYDLADNNSSALNIDYDNLLEAVNRIVDTLPDKCKKVFKLSRYEGKSHQEISDTLGISKKTIENHMTKALKTLREGLKRQELINIIFFLIKIDIILGEYPW